MRETDSYKKTNEAKALNGREGKGLDSSYLSHVRRPRYGGRWRIKHVVSLASRQPSFNWVRD